MISSTNLKVHKLENFTLKSGVTINLELSYLTIGELNEKKDNVIIYPTRYAGTHLEQGYLIGEQLALNPKDYFIIIPNMFCNGVSSSPSNTIEPLNGPNFPLITIQDNVTAQHNLVTNFFGIEKIKLVVGWSMGGQQAYQWATQYPDMVENIAAMCAHAKTSGHTHVFLEGMYAALTSDLNWNEGNYKEQPNAGKTTMAMAWAGWALGQNWFREKLYLNDGYKSPQEVLDKLWKTIYYKRDANDLLAMIRTWQEHDISNNEKYNGNIEEALSSIKANVVLMPGINDLYFPPEENKEELKSLKNGKLEIIPSNYGHYAGAAKSKEDLDFVNNQIEILL
ncbi:alpha/beta fold hydrolase [Alphaproteobacteria bacterium]|nr:alpha/beta fold hydrolase [Alphaproteobacteria bacterium]MDB4233973.1 alpha/beta fold hydrolase [Alphaproteobacteria bacterium]MDB9825161.1 alpha/beta fold hydrolase [Alphaproteobacteria bacterium]